MKKLVSANSMTHTHTHPTNSVIWHEAIVTRKHWQRHNTEGESWQKTPQTAPSFFPLSLRTRECPHKRANSTATERERWMTITWKRSFTRNTLAAQSTEKQLWPAREILADYEKTMLRTVCKQEQTELFKQRGWVWRIWTTDLWNQCKLVAMRDHQQQQLQHY